MTTFRPSPVVAILSLATAVGSACSLGGPQVDVAPVQPARQELTAVELRSAAGVRNLLDGIARLRPHFLRMRRPTDGSMPTVYLNGTLSWDVAVLRDVTIDEVRCVRYLDAAEATIRYGATLGGAVIEVTTGPLKAAKC